MTNPTINHTSDRRERRTHAAEQFADAADRANREGFTLIAHGNSGYELKRGEHSIGWFFPDHSVTTLKAFVISAIAREKVQL